VLCPADQYQLYQRTSGIPVAIHYAIAPLRGQPAHQILMVLSFFPAPVQRNTLIQIALSSTSFDIDYYQQERISEDAFARLQELSLVIQQDGRYSLLSLTREYVNAELKQHPDFEKQAREQWISWCLALAETYGNQVDWNWQYSNDVLEAEWLNIQSVIEWCMDERRYNDLYQLWKYFEIHIHLQGDRGDRPRYWGEHLEWIDWLIQVARNKNVQTAVELMLSRGWLLTAMGQSERLEEADRLYEEALGLRRHQLASFLQTLNA
jgi:hypothetical protein